MRSSSSFRQLAGVLEQLEEADIDVVDVTATHPDGASDPILRADLTIELPASASSPETTGTESIPTATDQPDDDVAVEASGNGTPSTDTTDTAEPRSSDEDETSDQAATSESRTDPAASETNTETESDTETDPETDDTPPAYRDPDKLETAYIEHDSFAAMTEALDVDVTPQTVRRHMIDHGIHDPESRNTSVETESEPAGSDDDPPATDDTGETSDDIDDAESDDTDSDPAVTSIPEGIELPDEIDIETLKGIVTDARTIHDVQREVDLDRQSTRELLESLNLLECVLGRLDEVDRDVPPEEIDERIDTATTEGNA